MSKIAAIDAGSNAMRMVVGEVDDAWRVKPVENLRLPVRLGRDVFGKGYLEEHVIQQTEEAFQRFRQMAENYNVQKMRAVATSAAREAANGDVLVDRIYRASGIELDIIDAEEEARLIHRAVFHSLKLGNKRTMLIDIGGGSIEVTVSMGQTITSTESYKLGTVRLLEALKSNSNSRRSFTALVREYADAARDQIEQEIGHEKIQICAGTGGNVEELGRLRQKLFKADSNRFITLEELEELIRRLDRLSFEERIQKWKLRPDRADVILPAAIVLHMIASEAGIKQIAIPNVGLKDGILLDLAEELALKPRLQRREQAWESALHLGHKYQFGERQARVTAKLSAQLFEQSRHLHHLHDDDLLLLEVASLLHDIGHFIDAVDHEKHAYYILTVNRLVGLSLREQNMIANIILYHGSRSPSVGDENFKSLSPADRLTVKKLAAIMRLASSIDGSRVGPAARIRLDETQSGWHIQLASKHDAMLAHWALANRKSMFEEVFGVRLEIS